MVYLRGNKGVGMLGALALALVALSLMVSGAHAGWDMVWNDEFDGTTLNPAKWDVEVNCWGGGNAEKQCYTNRQQNVYVSGGSLNLKPVAGNYQGSNAGCTNNNENSCTWTQPSTSGRVRTLNAVDGSWKYGRFEVRARLPKGDWLWPAIWMLPTDNVYGQWAGSGEIDIMESRGQVRNQVSSALHYGAPWPNNQHTGSGDLTFNGVDFTSDYRVYALEWDAKSIKMYIDGQLTWTQSLEKSFGSLYPRNGAPFDQRFHLVLNVAVAGNFFNPNRFGAFNINQASPSWTSPMSIDYVRVYKWTDAQAPVPVSPPVRAPVAAPVAAPVPVSPPVRAPVPVSPPVAAPVATPVAQTCDSLIVPAFPIDDTHTDSLRPDVSFGGESALQVRRTSSGAQPSTAYLKFYLPRGRTPTKATLSLYGALEEGTASLLVRGPISNSWSQSGLTFTNRPASTCATCASVTGSISTNIEWKTFDVLPIIKKAIDNGADVVSFSVELANAGHAWFSSSDAPSKRPIVNLSY